MILPPEIWRFIFTFDSTFREKYNICMDEMVTKWKYETVIAQLKSIISQNYLYVHDDLFRNDVYNTVNVINMDFIHFALRKATYY